jgi:hypothetical protein
MTTPERRRWRWAAARDRARDQVQLLSQRPPAEASVDSVILQPQLPLPPEVVTRVLTPTVSPISRPAESPTPWVARFESPLRIQKIGEESGRPVWRLTAPLRYRSLVLAGVGFDPVFEVPEGFETDLTSAPRLPMVFLFAGDTAHAPAALHDYLYRGKLFKRKVCDAVMNEAMGLDQPELGVFAVPTWRRVMMVGSLRAMGWWAWDRIVVATEGIA